MLNLFNEKLGKSNHDAKKLSVSIKQNNRWNYLISNPSSISPHQKKNSEGKGNNIDLKNFFKKKIIVKEKSNSLIERDLSKKSFFSKYYIPESKQWVNSTYTYNKSFNKLIPLTNSFVDKLIKGFFSLLNRDNNLDLDKKTKFVHRKRSIYRRNKSSINKIWLSKSETKHTNDKVIITIYMYNKKRNVCIYKLKNMYREILLYSGNVKPNNPHLFRTGNNKNLFLLSKGYNGNKYKKLIRLLYLNKLSKKPTLTFKKKYTFYKKITSYNSKVSLLNKKQENNNRLLFNINKKVLNNKYLSNKTLSDRYINKKRVTLETLGMNKRDVEINKDTKNLTKKFRAFTFHKSSFKSLYNKPDLFNATNKSTKISLSNFIKVIAKKNIISIRNMYSAFIGKYYLMYQIEPKSLYLKKNVSSLVELRKFNYLNNVNIVKNNVKPLQNVLHKTLALSQNSLDTLHCSKLLSKLHILNKRYTDNTTKNNILPLNIRYEALSYNKRGLNLKNKKYSYYNLIKLYKQAYVINECKANNNILTTSLTQGVTNPKNLYPNVKSRVEQLENINKKFILKTQKKIKRFLKAGSYNIKKLISIFNDKQNNFLSNRKWLNNYLTKVYGKEIALLRTLKNISVYSYINKNFFLNSLKAIITKIYKKKVELNVVNLKYIYLNSDIFTQSIASKLRNRRNKLLRLLKKSLNSVAMPNKNTSFYYKETKNLLDRNFINKYNNFALYIGHNTNNHNINNSTTHFTQALEKKDKRINSGSKNVLKTNDSLNKWIYNSFMINPYISQSSKNSNKHSMNAYKLNNNLGLEKTVIDYIKYKSVFGVRLEAAGRLTRRFTASRSVFKIKYIGSLRNSNSLNYPNYSPLIKGIDRPNLQFTKISSKTRNGSFGLKGWVSGY